MIKFSYLSIIVIAFVQTIVFGQEQLFFGIQDGLDHISFTTDDSKIIGTSGSEIGIWKVADGSLLKSIDLKDFYKEVKIDGQLFKGEGIGSAVTHPNGQLIGMVGIKYFSRELWKDQATIFGFYTIDEDKHFFLPGDAKDEVLRFAFHPTNPDLLGTITMDMDKFEYYSCLYNIKTNKIERKLLVGKGALMPLFIDFSQDGEQTYVGYGSSSYHGGFDVYETSTGKLIKKIPLKDQPHFFSNFEDQLIVGGHTHTYFYTKSNWQLTHTARQVQLQSVNQETKLASGISVPKDEFEMGEAIVYDVAEKKLLEPKFERGYLSCVSQSERKVAHAIHKRRKDGENTLEKPSIRVINY